MALLLIPVVQAEDANDWISRGWAALDAKQNTDALTYFNNALALDKNSASALAGKSVAFNALGDYNNAVDAATKALAINSNNEKALNARAYAFFKLRKYNESIGAYDTLFSSMQVNTADPYCNQAYAYWMLNKSDNAVVLYNKCIAFNPLDIVVWNNLGLVYMGQGNYESALSAFDSGTRLTVTNATLWNNKGKVLVALGRPVDALECFNKAIGIDPGFTDALANRKTYQASLQLYVTATTVTPVTTISRLGTFYTTATPTPRETPVATTPSPELTVAPPTPVEPVTTSTTAHRTTYSPLSPLTLLVAMLGACAIAALVKRRT